MLDKSDLKQIQAKGISVAVVEKQLEQFKNGFPYIDITAPAVIGNGIVKIDDDKVEKYQKLHRKMLSSKRVVKFVPASGAATRMFQNVYELIKEYDKSYEMYLNSLVDRSFNSIFYVCENMKYFAFYGDLKEVARKNDKDLNCILNKKNFAEALNLLISENGLNYGKLPKGLLKFHQYQDEVRTAAEEHLVEGAQYAASKGNVDIHFTVSPEHVELFEQLMKSVKGIYEERFSVVFNISYSIQDSATDTIAVDAENKPFRNIDNTILFRPAGHGALLKNLDDLQYDIVFVKNIDNVVTDRLKPDTVKYKQIIGGVLAEIQETITAYMIKLETPDLITDASLTRMVNYADKRLNNPFPYVLKKATREQKIEWLLSILNRPTRVCGMVKNEGEPGGGPFWVQDSNGVESLQIVEASQLDPKSKLHDKIVKEATHFNPVDLVCCITDYKGNAFDLRKYRDDNTGFISTKSKDGKDLKALELPGLWNGAMARWNTVFVEVPIATFNPVKTINDLLRAEHLHENVLMDSK